MHHLTHRSGKLLKSQTKFGAGRSFWHLEITLVTVPSAGMMHGESEVEAIAELFSPNILAGPDVVQE